MTPLDSGDIGDALQACIKAFIVKPHQTKPTFYSKMLKSRQLIINTKLVQTQTVQKIKFVRFFPKFETGNEPNPKLLNEHLTGYLEFPSGKITFKGKYLTGQVKHKRGFISYTLQAIAHYLVSNFIGNCTFVLDVKMPSWHQHDYPAHSFYVCSFIWQFHF